MGCIELQASGFIVFPKLVLLRGLWLQAGGSENILLELKRLGHWPCPLWPPCSITLMVLPLLTLLHFTVQCNMAEGVRCETRQGRERTQGPMRQVKNEGGEICGCKCDRYIGDKVTLSPQPVFYLTEPPMYHRVNNKPCPCPAGAYGREHQGCK